MKARFVLPVFAILAAGALVLAGCAVGTGGSTGAIRFAFSPGARSLLAGEIYRVEIYYAGDRYAVQETPTDTIVFDAVPVGSATVYVAQGTGSGDSFVATRSGSFPITIVAGDNTPDAVTLQTVPLVAANLGGAGVSSVVTLGGTVYAATTDGLRSASFGTTGFAGVTAGPVVPTGMSNVSLSIGSTFEDPTGYAPQVWVNGTWAPGTTTGTGGILPWVGGELDNTLAAGFSLASNWAAGTTPSAFTVLRSGTLAKPSSTDAQQDGLAIFYQRNGGFGGVFVKRSEAAAKATWPWIMNQIDLTAALGGVVAEGQEPVLDFVLSRDSAYLVTSFTTLKLSQDVLAPGVGAQSLLDPSKGFAAFASGIPSSVISIAVDETATTANPAGTVYLGTQSGLWVGAASASAGEFFTGIPTLVEGTSGYAIRRISVAGDGKHVALISSRPESPDYLVVYDVTAGNSTAYRTLQGLPGTTLAAITWLDSATLLVGGNAGLAALPVTD